MLRQVQALRLPKIVDRRTRRSDFDEFKLMKRWSPTSEFIYQIFESMKCFLIKFSYLRCYFLLAMFDLMERFLGGTGKGTFSTVVLKECSNKTTIFNQSRETIFAWYPHWPDHIYTQYRQCLFRILSTEKEKIHTTSTKIIPIRIFIFQNILGFPDLSIFSHALTSPFAWRDVAISSSSCFLRACPGTAPHRLGW